MASLERKQAARELLRRRHARKGLVDFTRYTFPQYRPADHHYMIADKLEAVQRGDTKRLMIFMPPRHGKSELASRRFPAFTLGLDPDKQFISASYNSELATDFGRDVRNIIKAPEYSALFDTTVAKDSGAADRWHTQGRGGYVAAGVGTAVTGRGAHIFTIDDPVKDREEAESETRRRKVYEWYTSTAYTRLESDIVEDIDPNDIWADVPGALADGLVEPFEGAIVLIQTRWHDDDLAGRLIEDMQAGADQWEVLELPAIGESGALWPAKYPEKRLSEIKRAIGPRDWSALYQQRPQPEEGTFFQREWFNRYRETPDPVTTWMTSDFATKDGEGDFTEHSVWGITADDDIYLRNNLNGQASADKWVEWAIGLIRQYKPLCWFVEGGVIWNVVLPMVKKAMREQNVYCRIEKINPVSDKPTRARAFQSRAAMGKVYFPEGEAGDRALDQLLRFPAGKHDDFVDTCSTMGMVIDIAHPAFVRPVAEKPDFDARPTFNQLMKSSRAMRETRI